MPAPRSRSPGCGSAARARGLPREAPMPDRKRTLLLAGLLALLGYGSRAEAEARSEGGASILPSETQARRHSGTIAIVLIVLALALAGGVAATTLKIKRERESD